MCAAAELPLGRQTYIALNFDARALTLWAQLKAALFCDLEAEPLLL
jgi:hypothetical protein